ncbi:lysine methyltransferase domain-containing protein [Trichoderma breve]|uniref:Lysine methyltransferase domain-containing protein n=1 Tax=Trichoderma breve TaxID=2034170 RepID=A0A9W9E6W4_9HYPO|nr:lysine methyltransferase domain-containing protein [Trichoderma breve]KAJ4858757.1 lysine methyltransferase domain-containing protein [Trichoderma breve]
MHYIRLLAPPKLAISGSKARLDLVITINTDLSDSLLFVQDSLEIIITAEVASSSGKTTWALTGRNELVWKPGMRILKPSLNLPLQFIKALAASSKTEICISAKPALSATGVQSILMDSINSAQDEFGGGLIMPVWAEVRAKGHSDDHICTRRLYFSGENEGGEFLEIEEELGKSYASNQGVTMTAMRDILCTASELNILELGCGVGTLGTGLFAALRHMRPAGSGGCTVLLTDLEDAEARASRNISRLQESAHMTGEDTAQLLYENLDWEDGREGRFGPQVQARRWDLIVLSDCTYNEDGLLSLVETLSALHASNVNKATGESFTTKVFVGTKPRHSSENAVFGLLDQAGWQMQAKQVLPLPVLGSEAQTVEMYLFEKS